MWNGSNLRLLLLCQFAAVYFQHAASSLLGVVTVSERHQRLYVRVIDANTSVSQRVTCRQRPPGRPAGPGAWPAGIGFSWVIRWVLHRQRQGPAGRPRRRC